MIVDDTTFNIQALKLLISNYQFKIDVAFNGVDAIKLVMQKEYRIVFMDVQMPLMDGIEATQKITELKNNKIISADVKVIIITAFGQN